MNRPGFSFGALGGKAVAKSVRKTKTAGTGAKVASFGSVLFQILLLDLVFSVDSILTAVGMTEQRYASAARAAPAQRSANLRFR